MTEIMKRILLGSAFALAALASAVGCGQKLPDGMPKLNPTTITVIQDGKPLEGAMVSLKPVDGQDKGAPTGKFKVAVAKTVGEGTPPPPSPIDAESARIYQEYVDSGATYEEFFVVAEEYRLVGTTPLEVEVVEGTNDLKVDVGEAVRDKADNGGGVL